VNVAAIDIGTNSVRLLVLGEDGRERVRLMQITRLGERVDQTGQLAPEAIERTLNVLATYADHIREHGVQRLRMTATSAARDASNRDAFFEPVLRLLGQKPELLPGDEEARLSFLGATASLTGPQIGTANPGLAPSQAQRYVVFDIGGGSTEFARGGNEPTHYLSLNMGSVRITERFLAADPASPDQIEQAQDFIRELLKQVRTQIPLDGSEVWVGVAGTVTSFAARAANLTEYCPERTHAAALSRAFVRQFTQQLSAADVAGRRALLLEPKRAAVMVGGALILDSIFEFFELQQVLSSERDILDGLAASLL
jgi:exopolyphosphatase / guanosine-5'-triphosphate,3'-diphosphate pyrophosphatase